VRKDTNKTVTVRVSLTITDLYRLILYNETPSGTHFNAYYTTVRKSSPLATSEDVLKTKEVNISTAY